jgi:hypothetical protein
MTIAGGPVNVVYGIRSVFADVKPPAAKSVKRRAEAPYPFDISILKHVL